MSACIEVPRGGEEEGMTASTLDAPLHRTFAQWFCVVAGAVLTVAGILGFAADGSFDTGSAIQGDRFLGLEVNGWHNVVHLVSGLVLLAAANTRPTAKTVAIAFGVVYAFVALWGLIDGDEVFNLFPVNGPDNVLHLILAAAALLAARMSPTTKGQQRNRRRDKLARKRGKDEDRERKAYVAETEAGAGEQDAPRR
jgi:hypothetical protein